MSTSEDYPRLGGLHVPHSAAGCGAGCRPSAGLPLSLVRGLYPFRGLVLLWQAGGHGAWGREERISTVVDGPRLVVRRRENGLSAAQITTRSWAG